MIKTITYNPDTHVLVPREPAQLQLNDGSEIDLAEETPEAYQEFLRDIYLSMVAAAPQTESNHNWCVGCSPDNCSGCGGDRVIDLKHVTYDRLVEAACNSKWIPKEYCANDWINDCIDFLINGNSKPDRTAELEVELAAAQAREQQLRAQILLMIDTWWPFVHGSFPSDTARGMFRKASDSIQPPHDTAALSAMIAKAEKMAIERCAEKLLSIGALGDGDFLAEIRALPVGQIKLEELL